MKEKVAQGQESYCAQKCRRLLGAKRVLVTIVSQAVGAKGVIVTILPPAARGQRSRNDHMVSVAGCSGAWEQY